VKKKERYILKIIYTKIAKIFNMKNIPQKIYMGLQGLICCFY